MRCIHGFLYILISFVIFTIIIYVMLDDIGKGNTLFINDKHFLCVLIPYRDRGHELRQLIPHLSKFLHRQNVLFELIIINQTDNYRFNRASLINVGWMEANRVGCDYMCMHDVDLLPLNPALNYRFPGRGIIRHISTGKYHPIKRYDYAKFIGGILMLTMDDFKALDGLSNKYWGWGLEDDEFYLRLRDANLTDSIDRPENLTTNRNNTFLHLHSKSRKRDHLMIGNQKKISRKRDRVSGLHSVQYSLRQKSNIEIDGFGATVLNVNLVCNTTWTPYCIPKKKVLS